MKTKHTPGPWHLKEVPTSCGNAFRIGTSEDLEKENGLAILYNDWTTLNTKADGEQLANARLIAAAPELLEALERLLDCASYDDATEDEVEIFDQALAAIKKAKGEA